MRIFPAYYNNNHRAIIICPGGGYASLSKWREGYMWVPFFHQLGYTVAVLEYRLPNHNCYTPMIDGTESIKYMRRQSSKWDYSKNKIGVMGFSAGGHIASKMMVSTNDTIRPRFVLLFYPIVSMRKEITHIESHDILLGKNASINLENEFSNEFHVSSINPPTFIAVSRDDSIVNPLNSIILSDEINLVRRPVSLHIYPKGGHGWGYMYSFPYRKQMIKDMLNWLDNLE